MHRQAGRHTETGWGGRVGKHAKTDLGLKSAVQTWAKPSQAQVWSYYMSKSFCLIGPSFTRS